ncbi:MTH1187 family thiamine-binding protein [Desulfolucanica intricata]|uniref:MTH1187 family thiamine-binding protein n=1 Tax=Desulfolucanica intricata TaxID=1285191 RepID=UPI000831F7BA|nr:MTH1187 family thiamine-binding protein [Desulfolucanica intricata]
MAVVELNIIPIGTKTTSVSSFVAQCLSVLKDEKDVNYRLTPMGTIIEGDLDKVLSIVRKMHEEPFKSGISRVVTDIRIDDRRDKKLTMEGKLSSVQNKLTGAGGEK